MKLKILAPAKINLYLEILKKKNDEPMHDVELVMQSVSLFDVLRISCAKINSGDNEINLQVNSDLLKELPVEKNLAYIACREFLKSLNLTGYSVEIDIENKKINTVLCCGDREVFYTLCGTLESEKGVGYHCNKLANELIDSWYTHRKDVQFFVGEECFKSLYHYTKILK